MISVCRWSWCFGAGSSNTDQTNSNSSAMATSISAGLLLLILLMFQRWKKAAAADLLPPGPRGLPLLGYLPFVGTQLHKKFTELSKIYGPIYKLWLGNKLFVVVSSTSLMKEVVRDHDVIFANRDPPFVVRISGYDGNDIGWMSYGPEWKKLRKVFVREMLSNRSLEACYPLRKREVRKTVQTLFCNANKGPVNVGESAFLTNLNATMSVLWGATLEGEEGVKAGLEFRKLLNLLLNIGGRPNLSDFFPTLARFDLQGLQHQSKSIFQQFDRFLDSAIEQGLRVTRAEKGEAARKNNNQRKDFLQLLLELKENNDPETSLTMIQIKAMLMDIVIGGSDTTSTTVEWAISELIQHQEKKEKVQRELDEVVGLNEFVEESHLPRLHYLDAVVKETLRLHPPLALLLPHVASKSCTLGGYTIPKGTTVILNAYAIQRDPQLWDNPLEFKPERFMDDEEGCKYDFSGNNFQYTPFGSGRRICAGLPLVEKMLFYQLATFLHSFDWKLPDDATNNLDLSDEYGLVLKKSKPLIAIPTPRLFNLNLYNL